MDNSILDLLEELAAKHYILVEYGLESCNDHTLALINRCHTFHDSVQAIEMTRQRGIQTGVHLILGLPGETREIMLHHAALISELHIKTLKLHQLQIIRGTAIETMFGEKPEIFPDLSLMNYIELVLDFIEHLNPNIVIERFSSESPVHMIISPNWGGLKNFEIVHKIEKRLEERDTWQGKLYR